MARQLLCGDTRQKLAELAPESVHVVVTSPPYWGLRKYAGEQEVSWLDGPDCAYGLEKTPELYIQHSVEILQGIRQVLRPDGVVFWNIGDSYYGGTRKTDKPQSFAKGNSRDLPIDERPSRMMGDHPSVKPLDLCLIPERLAIALQEDGWWCRSIIVWYKSNPMPESVNGWRWEKHKVKAKKGAERTQKYGDAGLGFRDHSGLEIEGATEWQDCPGCPKCSSNDGLVLRKGSWRPTDAYEQILMLTKSKSYYADAEAVKESSVTNDPRHPYTSEGAWEIDGRSKDQRRGGKKRDGEDFSGRNLRNVWSFPTKPYPEAHFAVFPEKLPDTCIKAATPEAGVCAKCGAPYARLLGKVEMVGWRPTCSCNCPDTVPATVLDPFAGAGTTMLVAERLGRNSIGIDISADYCTLAIKRILGVK